MVKHGVTEFLSVFQDVSTTFFDLETDLLIVLGEQGNIERVNPSFERVLNYCTADVAGQSLIRFVYMDDWSKFLNAFTAVQPQPFRMLRKPKGEIEIRLIAWRHRNNHSYIIFRTLQRIK